MTDARNVVVPIDPTPEMLGSWYRVKNGHHYHDEPPPTDTSDYAAYRAMLAAAPAPSSLAGGEEAEFATALARVLDRHGLKDAGWAAADIDEALSVVREPSAVSRATVDAILPMISERLAALSPEAPAREGGDLEELLTTAITAELEDGGAEVPYNVIAERVAARVVDEASAPSCALTTAAEEALSFLQNAPLESGICCCGDPISGHGYGSGHSPVDDLAYHSSQVAEKLQLALTPRHEAPADHHERNLTASNAELIEQAFLHPPLEAPAEGAGEVPPFDPDAPELAQLAVLCAEAIERVPKWIDDGNLITARAHAVVLSLDLPSALRARSSAPEAREGEAVAWRFRDHPNSGWVYTGLGGRHDGCEVEPLYIHPATAAREPDGGAVLDAAAAYLKQQYGASHGLDHPTDRERILSSIPAAPSADKLREFGQHTNLELSYRHGEEGDDGSWQVHRVNGGVNDREWTLIGSGATPSDAIDQALAALKAEGA